MFSSLQRGQLRRWDEEVRKRLRQLSLPRRVTLLAVFAFLLIYYFLISSSSSTPSAATACINDRVRHWKLLNDFSISSQEELFFVGNGFFGVGGDRQLRVGGPSLRVLSRSTAFYPLLSARVEHSGSEASASVTDYHNGIVKSVSCFSMDGGCVCITRSAYAHRTRPHLFIQDIQTTNPTDNSVEVKLKMDEPKHWIKGENVDKTFVNSRTLELDGERIAGATICSFVPDKIVIEKRREESERFTCVFNFEALSATDDEAESRKKLGRAVLKEFADSIAMRTSALDREHEEAWHTLNEVTFGISKSLAPDALNAAQINGTRYALLSNVRAPLLEYDVPAETRKSMEALLFKNDMCYSGHSTLLVPSRLWKKSSSVGDLIETVDVWLLTLENRGCVNLVKAGATGVAEAFALSLLASKFSRDHLEVELNPADIHRDITVENLSFSPKVKLAIEIHLDADNRLYFLVSSSAKIYVCDAGCMDRPVEVGRKRTRVPVKVTNPPTPILYFSASKEHLEQLRGAIHIIEVVEAPAREQELIALHKHGHRLGGLPVAFWVLLAALVLAFHLFLFKLVYSEWKKTDSTPYNYYLRQRYLRNH